MAVELAKVALWLHTFTVGAPEFAERAGGTDEGVVLPAEHAEDRGALADDIFQLVFQQACQQIAVPRMVLC